MNRENNPHSKLTEETLYKMVTEKLMSDEIKKIDEEIYKSGIDMPEPVKKKLEERYNLNLSKESNNSLKIATCIILTAIFLVGLVITEPSVVTAVKNNLRGIFYNEDTSAVEITLEEFILPEYTVSLPEGFNLTDSVNSKNFQRFTYENPDGIYFQISLYADSYKLILDNEDFDIIKKITLNDDLIGQMYVKNGISKIVFKTNNKIIEIQSDLSEEEVEAISQTIYF